MSGYKNNKGITLVALIITIIVLLILAIVSISLVMNGGIIDRAERGKDKYSEEEIGEQLKLAYSEYEMAKYDSSFDVQQRLQQIYGENTTAEINNGKLKAKIKGKDYMYNSITGKAGEYIDTINYREKTKATVAPGDTITLGTEQFMVFSKTDTEIKAMPYYNIELNLDNPKQNENAEGIGFASEYYWETNVNEIDMSNSKNKVQKYIDAYKKTLENMGADFLEVRISRLDELLPVVNYRNPSGIGEFWIGSSDQSDKQVKYVEAGQGINYTTIWYKKGVRPIIIIH